MPTKPAPFDVTSRTVQSLKVQFHAIGAKPASTFRKPLTEQRTKALEPTPSETIGQYSTGVWSAKKPPRMRLDPSSGSAEQSMNCAPAEATFPANPPVP